MSLSPGRMRISPFVIYNTVADVDALLESLS